MILWGPWSGMLDKNDSSVLHCSSFAKKSAHKSIIKKKLSLWIVIHISRYSLTHFHICIKPKTSLCTKKLTKCLGVRKDTATLPSIRHCPCLKKAYIFPYWQWWNHDFQVEYFQHQRKNAQYIWWQDRFECKLFTL